MNLESILIMTVSSVRTFSAPFEQLSGRAKFIFNAIKNNIIIYHWETKTCFNDKKWWWDDERFIQLQYSRTNVNSPVFSNFTIFTLVTL